ncbi:MAG: phosphonate ABC transporter ATP-binding protein [Crocinitomicaceae bacterium]|nr:phosphonate ABC transporter ATP-binding protein [Crocinitomicaceae bacterium]|tara:strand:+ start:4936 stop:5604 length:669 start_codon:yes stop_codon:yes gene_type:complete
MTESTIIELNNVEIKQQQNVVLKNITLKINKGEFVYFVGKTGSGKSSLLKSLYGDISINDGAANVLNYDIIKSRRKKILSLRRKMGIVFQDFELLMDRSVSDNLKFVMKATGWRGKQKINTAINELLEKVGMTEKANSYPHLISGGEQQRIAIARALVNDPELILADEPTGNLDPETSFHIMNLLKEISSNGKTIIMATHDYNTIEKFKGRIIKFENQHISE